MTVSLELVAAVAANGVIGRGGQLPWHLPDDLKHFKSITIGRPVIMGRRTYESIGKPLPGRKSIVVSTTWDNPPAEGVVVVRSLGEATQAVGEGTGYVIGGGVLYEAALPLARVLHLTELDDVVEGDAYFPAYDRTQWRLVSERRHPRDDRHAYSFRFCTYERL
jgi:dihydrofolate reductase